MMSSVILNEIQQIAKTIKSFRWLNERYVHHYFSFKMQKSLPCLFAERSEFALHAEWPTYKEKTDMKYGRYRKDKINKTFILHPEGSAGFIDFAIGRYNKPRFGVEFTLKYGWSKEEIVYDFMKLLDKDNPFKAVFSLNIIIREKSVALGGRKKSLRDAIESVYKQACGRLGNNFQSNRRIFFIVTELDNVHRNHWHFDQVKGYFVDGL